MGQILLKDVQVGASVIDNEDRHARQETSIGAASCLRSGDFKRQLARKVDPAPSWVCLAKIADSSPTNFSAIFAERSDFDASFNCNRQVCLTVFRAKVESPTFLSHHLWRRAMTFFTTVRRKTSDFTNVEEETPTAFDTLCEKRERVLRSLAMDPEAIVDGEITVQQIMSTRLTTVAPDSRFSDIKKKMARQRLRHLLVTDSEGRLLGLISDRDLARRNGLFAKQVMTRDPLSAPPHTRVNEAISAMLGKRISCLPIVDNGRLIGILTTVDLLLAFQGVLAITSQTKPITSLHAASST
jgi:acetoin utilization protein AcuB